ncbi:hypothetical protein C7M52_00652 [Mixta theicola]|nr:hypothetical protein C7M52_00652 [Mixta theicola]
MSKINAELIFRQTSKCILFGYLLSTTVPYKIWRVRDKDNLTL